MLPLTTEERLETLALLALFLLLVAIYIYFSIPSLLVIKILQIIANIILFLGIPLWLSHLDWDTEDWWVAVTFWVFFFLRYVLDL